MIWSKIWRWQWRQQENNKNGQIRWMGRNELGATGNGMEWGWGAIGLEWMEIFCMDGKANMADE